MLLWLTFVVDCRSPVLECESEARRGRLVCQPALQRIVDPP